MMHTIIAASRHVLVDSMLAAFPVCNTRFVAIHRRRETSRNPAGNLSIEDNLEPKLSWPQERLSLLTKALSLKYIMRNSVMRDSTKVY
jgi:hypothetical protein